MKRATERSAAVTCWYCSRQLCWIDGARRGQRLYVDGNSVIVHVECAGDLQRDEDYRSRVSITKGGKE